MRKVGIACFMRVRQGRSPVFSPSCERRIPCGNGFRLADRLAVVFQPGMRGEGSRFLPHPELQFRRDPALRQHPLQDERPAEAGHRVEVIAGGDVHQPAQTADGGRGFFR